ncbi:uncharacterized protein [Danio rerio]|uniref:ribonuclease H n=1 Tax=Danio rerio TaxID=7955 RepID=A0A8M2BF71_DANRE|nr:uncharacterized protein LOC101886700 [Danio rerio]XP_021334139.1 uncharacterized protein LOC101886700 [Danio rerio]|eukprot:XP_005167247.1 uncharacterized protein LOC101886700 [Danio rerio]
MQSEQEVTPTIVQPRTQRERHPPAYLGDYDVGYQPSQIPASSAGDRNTMPAAAIASAHPDEAHVPCRSLSAHSSAKSRQSRSRTKTTRSSVSSRSTASQLTELQAAIVEEKLKSMELAEMQRQMVEESKAEEQCEFLDQQARLALYEREELLREQQRRSHQLDEEARAAHKTKELITKQLERQRRIKQKEMELEKARLVASLLRESESENATAISQTEGELDPEQVQTDTLRLPKVEVAHHTLRQFPDSTQHSTPHTYQSKPVTAQPLVPHSVHEHITSHATSKSLYVEPMNVVPSPICSVAAPGVFPSQVKLHVADVCPPLTVQPSLSYERQTYSQLGSNLLCPGASYVSPDSTATSYAQPPHQSISVPSQPTINQSQNPVRQQQLSSQPLPRLNVPSVQPPAPANVMDMLIANSYGIPKPALPTFESGRESDFALLKMALDSLIGCHAHLTEQFKYQVLLDRIRLPSAYKLAQAYMHDPTPYTTALQALQDKYGQPRQLVQSELGSILNSPPVRVGDAEAFDNFALAVHALVGMLRSLEGENGYELKCGSHVDRLLVKLPATYRDGFVEHCLSRGILVTGTDKTYTLHDLAAWLQLKSQAKRISSRAVDMFQEQIKPQRKGKSSHTSSSSVYYNISSSHDKMPLTTLPCRTFPQKPRDKPKAYCPYCNTREHYLSMCSKFKSLTTTQITEWIRDKGCFRCGRNHKPEACTLKKPCNICQNQHLTVLHDVNMQEPNKVLMVSTSADTIYLDRPNRPQQVMLKVVKVLLHNARHSLEAYALLDDGSERTILLSSATQYLQLHKNPETLSLRTVRHEVVHLKGSSVSFEISPADNPRQKYKIHHAFTADELGFSEHTYPVKVLMKKYKHLRGLPIPEIDHVRPVLLIGSDFPHLLIPTQPVHIGPAGGPVAICTPLGWTLQGPASLMHVPSDEQRCLFTAVGPTHLDLQRHVEKLWQIDTLPYISEKAATRSKLDQQALELLEQQTVRVNVNGTMRYATPLLRRKDSPCLKAPKSVCLSLLRSTERRIINDPNQTLTYCEEIQKLENAGYVKRLTNEEVESSAESWYLPHHLVHHNNKARLVFNCSYQYRGLALNEHLLPGPILGPSLLGVLLRFREHTVAISGDIKAMFHQIRLLPEDRSLLRFLWRDMKKNEEPNVFEWQVLPFGTTCSPCCATYALQRHVKDNCVGYEDVQMSVEQAFYVDNCLQSLNCPEKARSLIDRMRSHLSSGGFEIRQWASNIPQVIEHLPIEARAASTELWVSEHSSDPQEPALGLRWNCLTDHLGYQHRQVHYSEPTLRNVYKVLATQYDPLGYLIPFTTKAKILIQDLWNLKVGWDDVIHPESLRIQWRQWEAELANLHTVEIPRAYIPPCADTEGMQRTIHIFCDASERAYGSVAYLCTLDQHNQTHVAFVMARSRVAPRKQISMPRLELCGALTGAQLAKLLSKELSIPARDVVLWTDSTTVLSWLKSDSCRYKVFVGTRIAEIQDLALESCWRYVNTADNPADDLTRGKTLVELTKSQRWSQGPQFIHQHPDTWPSLPELAAPDDHDELRKQTFCGNTIITTPQPAISNCKNWSELLKFTYQSLHGAADSMTAADAIEVELHILRQAQSDSFPEEVGALTKGKPISTQSRLAALAPVYDQTVGLIRVGGRLRRAECLVPDTIHPIILDPKHPITMLLIKKYDNQLLHPGPERVLGEIRRKYWILRGRESIKRHQYNCETCQKWRAKPVIPKMADLPPSRLRLYKPPFWSTGVDCFGPFTIKIGRRTEKRWGIIFKCMTTSCIHLDLLESMDTDAFLMALRRFVSRRGKPFEILADRGTNFRGGATELQEAFTALEASLKEQLAGQEITFQFNPPHAPHFGGTWEREIRSVKTALQVVLGNRTVTESVLRTVLVEVEGIINSKPLGYVSSDVADPDPVTPNLLLMGRRDASLPQAIYSSSDLLGRRRWRHSQILADHFWVNFVRHYLPGLQTRQKWQRDTGNLTIGQIVMIVDPQLPRASWPIGKVIKTYAGVDHCVRTAEVQVKERTYLRPVARLVKLPSWEDEEGNN